MALAPYRNGPLLVDYIQEAIARLETPSHWQKVCEKVRELLPEDAGVEAADPTLRRTFQQHCPQCVSEERKEELFWIFDERGDGIWGLIEWRRDEETWKEFIIEALRRAPRPLPLRDLYDAVQRLVPEPRWRRSQDPSATIRRTLQENCPQCQTRPRRGEIFRLFDEPGDGIWGLADRRYPDNRI